MATASHIENRRGIALMLVAMACYVFNDALIKLAAPHCTAGQILALRGVCATTIVLALALPARTLAAWRTALRPIVALRTVLEVSTAVTSVLALARMPLATVTAVMMSAPLLVMIVSMGLRMEARRSDRFIAAAVGFAGVLVILRPTMEVSAAGLAFTLACTVSLAARELVNRRVPADVPSLLIATLTTVAVTITGLAMTVIEPWRSPAPSALTWIAGAAVFTAIGNYAVIAATRRADLSAVAPFRYSAIVWALLLGYLAWNDVPDGRTWAGIFLVAASGLHMLRTARR